MVHAQERETLPAMIENSPEKFLMPWKPAGANLTGATLTRPPLR